jgi:hypothetical protein
VLFSKAQLPALRTATDELSWLIGRGYAPGAATKLVEDRHALTARQRKAVVRASCADEVRHQRLERRSDVTAIVGRSLHVDAFNCIILGESILSGAPVFLGRDGALRDLASVHGTWRRVRETERAITALADLLDEARPADVTWWLDRPVSNSGRLAGMLRDTRPWRVELVDHVDPVVIEQQGLADQECVVATGDAWILDRARAWVDLPQALAAREGAWLVDLSTGP